MLKKLVLIIGLVLLIVFAVTYFTISDSNDENSVAAYGRFENDHFISEYIGLDVDMSDKWVYFTLKTLSKSGAADYAEEYGLDLSSLSNEEFFLTMIKPGVVACFIDDGEMFSVGDMTEKNVDDLAYFMYESYRASGNMSDLALLDSGIMKSSDGITDIAYITMRFTGEDNKRQYFTYSFFNTEKTGIEAVGVRNENTDENAFINLLKNDLKFIYTEGEEKAA